MSYALYLDPSKKNSVPPHLPASHPRLSYWRLIDLDVDALVAFNPDRYPDSHLTIAEIHPAQLEMLRHPVNRLSIVQQKSTFRDLSQLKKIIGDIQCDITYEWDHRFHVDYYIKLLRYWIHCGVQHFSIYELNNFAKWQRIKQFLAEEGYFFYDRYHACLPEYESPYQKHLAQFGDLYGIGGFSRVTEDGVTRVKEPQALGWDILSSRDQLAECLLFAMADIDGIDVEGLNPKGIETVCQKGLAEVRDNRLIPTDMGLWDTVGLVSHLHQS